MRSRNSSAAHRPSPIGNSRRSDRFCRRALASISARTRRRFACRSDPVGGAPRARPRAPCRENRRGANLRRIGKADETAADYLLDLCPSRDDDRLESMEGNETRDPPTRKPWPRGGRRISPQRPLLLPRAPSIRRGPDAELRTEPASYEPKHHCAIAGVFGGIGGFRAEGAPADPCEAIDRALHRLEMWLIGRLLDRRAPYHREAALAA